MADGKSKSPQRQRPRQEPPNSSHNSHDSKLPRLGRRCHQDPWDQVQMADSDSNLGSRKHSPSKTPTRDTKSIIPRGRKREVSASSSIASQDSSDLSNPYTPPRTTRTAASQARIPRTTSDYSPHSPSVDNQSSSLKDSISAARVSGPSPNISSHIPRILVSKRCPSYQVFKRKDSGVKDASKMENVQENGVADASSNLKGELQNGDIPMKGTHDFPDHERSTISMEGSDATTIVGLESTADVDETNVASYASALKSDLNGEVEETGDSPPRRGLHTQDDDDSYPELDDMTLDEIHLPPKPSANGGIRWAPWNVPLKRRLQTLVVLMHCMCIALTVSIFFALSANPFVWPLLLIYLLHCLSSKAATDGKLKYRSEWFRKSYIWHLFAGYFPAKLYKTHDLPPTRKYIFGYHPHGIISHGAWAAFATDALGFSEKFPGITNSLLTLDSNFRIPLYREYILAAGMRSVSKESIVNILSKGGPNGEGMGRGVTIVIGGARESLEAQPGQLRLILKERKGFVKIAVRTGADLVPVLAFGENNLYDQLHPKEHPMVHKVQMFVLKVWKFTLPFLHGRGIFNYDVGLMPYRRPLNIVVGAPIKVTQSNSVDQEEINRLHDLYVTELEKLWDRYKDEFAPDRKEEMQILS
ncbi:DAGAT-domain-containing protein [Annulohypoxylon truncatum]|uniref:DAGAT-domain-containing protein n=1 Tax=Annulohypoxylon truncatum TaxID=327061 RepID=UPI002007B33C|nr:DAGAT-domain-containing protein [Annulohypoxylon truncatum]KAI1211057.1 DAGAT-domain-containing protein [Annulohypoxylon truncatum]